MRKPRHAGKRSPRFVKRLIARLDRATAEKDLLLRESNQRIKNNFAVAESFPGLRGSPVSGSDSRPGACGVVFFPVTSGPGSYR